MSTVSNSSGNKEGDMSRTNSSSNNKGGMSRTGIEIVTKKAAFPLTARLFTLWFGVSRVPERLWPHEIHHQGHHHPQSSEHHERAISA